MKTERTVFLCLILLSIFLKLGLSSDPFHSSLKLDIDGIETSGQRII